ncbi:autotransporter outer membrane beta-barrel domain-containing protein [Caenispirillum bisanense]|uniref:Outer membrane autotransporter barrel domain-containing protein n=1 Tax=Caenispirillum bisanense TaxID=414052 RepID=A0A286H0X6_9PROT|nr:autotransporter outer membrane beta-barrel domain-containing protein [Caenispirillum bisanense]SOE01417.1 outer membrane autotransporter barrel domain-containing protein [Caenispirillum bisanense]
MVSKVRGAAAAVIVFTGLTAVGGAAQAQTSSVVTRPDGTQIQTTVFSPTSIRINISGGPDYTSSPMEVNYTNISYGAGEIVYQGTYTYKGVTEPINCRVNSATGAVSGSSACQSSLGTGSSSSTATTTSTTSTTTQTGSTATTSSTVTTTAGTTTVVTTTNTATAASQGRDWVKSGVLQSLLPGDGVARVVESLAAVQTAGLDPFYEAVAGLATNTQRAAAVKQLQPVSPGAQITSAVATAQAVTGTVLGRTTTVRGGTGVSTGDLTRGLGVWVQPFAYNARQDMRDGQDGYEDTTYGVAIGADTAVADSVRVGLALSYASADVDGRDASVGDTTDGSSGQATLYAQYEGEAVYVTGQVFGGLSAYDGRRRIAPLGSVADADYDGWQAGARVDAGMPIALGSGWQVTPMAGLAYVHTHIDAYTETGAGALNLTVGDRSNDALTASLGGRVAVDLMADGFTWTPYLQGIVSYDLIGERPETTSRFAAGGASFVTQGADPARLGADLTVGLELMTDGNLSVDAAYTFGLRQDYRAHAGAVQVRMAF